METSLLVCQNQSLAGGWSQMGVSPESQEALVFALDSIGKEAAEAHIVVVYSQVVNGINYAIEFKMNDGQRYHTQVYRTFQGKMSLTVPPQPGKLCS